MYTKLKHFNKVSNKVYKCSTCGHERIEKTDHTENCLIHCNNCSWKGLSFGHGIRIEGLIHRKFTFIKVYTI
jgi:DNA-directed RNA polymerase subunit RPC12/RpoP